MSGGFDVGCGSIFSELLDGWSLEEVEEEEEAT